jgi:phospholipid/cholesterol/gamma-HCH transport system ATP-binding protein
VTPAKGDVYYNGVALKEMSFEEFAPIRSSTSFSFDNGGLLMNKTLLENLKLGLLYHNQWRYDRNEKLLQELVEHFEIGEFLHLRPASVSRGVCKITGLVRAFLSNAQVLFLDEPSLGIGEAATKSLHFWLEKHRKESKEDEVVVVASSDTGFLAKFHGERYRLDHGILKPLSQMIKDAA